MGQLQRVVEDPEILLQGHGCPWQLLLVKVNEVTQLGGMVDEDQLAVVLPNSDTSN